MFLQDSSGYTLKNNVGFTALPKGFLGNQNGSKWLKGSYYALLQSLDFVLRVY